MRLRGENKPNVGIVEMKVGPTWGTIAGSKFDKVLSATTFFIDLAVCMNIQIL